MFGVEWPNQQNMTSLQENPGKLAGNERFPPNSAPGIQKEDIQTISFQIGLELPKSSRFQISEATEIVKAN